MSGTQDLPSPLGGRAYGVPARRESIIALLTEAYARNDLEQSVFERRVAKAQEATTLEELEALVADFPPEARGGAPGVPAAGVARGELDPRELERLVTQVDGEAAPTRFSLLGDQHLSINPSDRRVIRAVSVVGDVHLDLRALAGETGVFLLKIAALVGDTRITVPAGTRVESRALTLVGDQRRRSSGEGFLTRIGRKLGVVADPPPSRGPPGPTVVITGFKLVGDLKIREV